MCVCVLVDVGTEPLAEPAGYVVDVPVPEDTLTFSEKQVHTMDRRCVRQPQPPTPPATANLDQSNLATRKCDLTEGSCGLTD